MRTKRLGEHSIAPKVTGINACRRPLGHCPHLMINALVIKDKPFKYYDKLLKLLQLFLFVAKQNDENIK